MNPNDPPIPRSQPAATGFRGILRNSATLIGARIVSKFAMTVFMVILARRLGIEDFGVYSSILAFIAFFSLIEEFGMTPPMIRKISRSRPEGGAILGSVLGLKLILGGFAYAALMIASFWLDISPGITAILGLSMIFEILALTVTRAFEAFERMKYIAVITIIERVLLGVTGLGAVYMGWSLPGLSYAYLFTFLVSLVVSVCLFRRHIAPFELNFPRHEWKALLREAIPFLTASVLSLIWTRSDIYFLTSYRTSAEVGWYTAALRIVEAQIFIPVAILGSVFPVLARLYGPSLSEFTRILVKNFYFLLGVGFILAAGIYLYSAEIVLILFGQDYRESAQILRIYSPVIMFTFVNYLLGGALIAMGRERLATMTLGLGAALCVVCGFYFIPGGGGRAAGYIKLVAEAFSFVFQSLLLIVLLRRSGMARVGPDDRPSAVDHRAYQTITSGMSDG